MTCPVVTAQGDNGFKLCQIRLGIDIRKIFTVRVVKHWHRSAQRGGDASSLETFKAGLDRALSNLRLVSTFQPKLFYDYKNLQYCGGP